MTMLDANAEKRVMDRVEEIDAEFRAGLRKRFEAVPTGFERVTDEEWAAMFERREFEAGWGTVTDPKTGAELFVNLFTFALGMDTVDGGKAMLARYARIRGKQVA